MPSTLCRLVIEDAARPAWLRPPPLHIEIVRGFRDGGARGWWILAPRPRAGRREAPDAYRETMESLRLYPRNAATPPFTLSPPVNAVSVAIYRWYFWPAPALVACLETLGAHDALRLRADPRVRELRLAETPRDPDPAPLRPAPLTGLR